MTTTTKTATLEQLRPGHEHPEANINSRTTYRDADIDQLAALLHVDGQLAPLLVCTHVKKPGDFFVIDGNRRRTAFGQMLAAGLIPKTHPIEVKDFGNIFPDEALAKSWAANEAIPLHPADRCEVFAKLNGGGEAPDVIAKRYGMTTAAVQQSLALGNRLAPEILAAWRAGDLNRESVEVFTLCEDFAEQADEFEKLKEDYGYQHGRGIDLKELRRKFMRNKEPEMKRLLGVVGRDDYVAAGGTLNEDFFGSGGVVKDMKLLKKLAKAKLDEAAQKLSADGWSWIDTRMTHSHMHHGHGVQKATPDYEAAEKTRLAEIGKTLNTMEDTENEPDEFVLEALEAEKNRIEAAAQMRGYSKAQKAKGGVIVSVKEDGSLHYQPGLIRKAEPENKAKGSRAPAQQREPDPLDWSARTALAEWQNQAAGELLAKHPKEALAAFLAAAQCADYDDPISAGGGGKDFRFVKAKNFRDACVALRKLPIDDLVDFMAQFVATCTDISDHNREMKPGAAEIIAIIGETAFGAAMAAKFDAKVYFNGASKTHMLGVIAEAEGEEARAAAEKKTVEALRKGLTTSIPKSGWLPPELRTAGYAGPSHKAVKDKAKTEAKPKRAAAPKRKAA